MSQQRNQEKATFASRLRSRLTRLGMQSNEVAEKLQVSESSISNWLSGVNAAKGTNLRKLAELLSVPVPWLIGESDNDGFEDEFRSSYITREGRMEPKEELAYWRARAREAEKRLSEMQSALRSVLELSTVGAPMDKATKKARALDDLRLAKK